MIIPSIDIMGGKAVKLVRGDPKKKEFEIDAIELALEFSIFPEVNLIDLDAALGTGENQELIRKICKICICNVGGGIRTLEKAYALMKAGAKKIIIGTRAEKEFLSRLPKDKIIVALDSRNGSIVNEGWQNSVDKSPIAAAEELKDYCSGFLYTFVDNEGTMSGIDLSTITRLREITSNRIMYAGGISDKGQILALGKLGIDAVVGMAYYREKINIKDCFVSMLDFSKGLIPTIVKDQGGRILMQAFSSKESLMQALEKRRGVYYSRSRQNIWAKGETSGNVQELLRIRTDCDNDSLIFTVNQKNIACHKGDYSCFGEENFDLNALLEIIKSREGTGTFTDTLMSDEILLKEKILEEAAEVADFRDKANLKWEIADLMYFISILMVKNGIDFADIENELETRDSMKKLIKTTKLGL